MVMYQRFKFWTVKKEDISQKFLVVFSFIFMAESWPKYIQGELLNSEFDFTTHANAEHLAV